MAQTQHNRLAKATVTKDYAARVQAAIPVALDYLPSATWVESHTKARVLVERVLAAADQAEKDSAVPAGSSDASDDPRGQARSDLGASERAPEKSDGGHGLASRPAGSAEQTDENEWQYTEERGSPCCPICSKPFGEDRELARLRAVEEALRRVEQLTRPRLDLTQLHELARSALSEPAADERTDEA